MTWKRGSQSVEVELSRLQEKAESWSEDLDGEAGLIRLFREERAERKGTMKIFQGLAWVFAALIGAQAFLDVAKGLHWIP
jgi:hypothetical protein